MKVLVALRDNRTVLIVESRGKLGALLSRGPANDEAPIKVQRAFVEPDGFSAFHEVGFTYLNKNQVGSVEEVTTGG